MGNRDYIGLSEVGQCLRRTAYRLLGKEEVYSFRTKYYFAVGHAMEKVRRSEILANEGRKVGLAQVEVHCGKAIGHLDGVITVGKAKVVWECKSSTAGKIAEWKTDGFPKNYIYQVNGYMHGLSEKLGKNVDTTFLDAGDRTTMTWERFVIKRDDSIVEDVIKRANLIDLYLASGTVPHREYGRFSQECGMCPFYSECWNGEQAETKTADQDEDYDKVARAYAKLKANEKANDTATKELRGVLLEATKNYGGRAVTKSGITLAVTQQNRKSLDKAALEKDNPGLIAKYEKPSVSEVLTLKGGDDE